MNVLQFIELLSPHLVAELGYKKFNNPQSAKYRDFEKTMDDEAVKSTIEFKGKNIAIYTWGDGEKKALLIHGWEGRATNFGKLIPILVSKGYQVIGFDAPSHGRTDKFKNSFATFEHLATFMLEQNKYELLITHSTGSSFGLWGLHKLNISIPKVFICTTPNTVESRFQLTMDQFGLGNKTMKHMMRIFQKDTGHNPDELVSSQFVQSIDFDQIIFISDEKDKVIPLEWTNTVHEAIPNSELKLLNGTGHFRMLWSEQLEALIEEKA